MTNPYPPPGRMPWQQGPPPQGPPGSPGNGFFNGHETQTVESPREEEFWAEYLRSHPPIIDGLVRQYPLGDYKLDFALPHQKVNFEIDGYTFHKDREPWCRDRRRDLFLSLQGWRVYRFDGDLVKTDPQSVVTQAARIVEILATAQADLMMARAMERIAMVLERIEARLSPLELSRESDHASM